MSTADVCSPARSSQNSPARGRTSWSLAIVYLRGIALGGLDRRAELTTEAIPVDQDHQHLAEARDIAPGNDEASHDGIQIVPDEARRRVGAADVLVALAGFAALTIILLIIVF